MASNKKRITKRMIEEGNRHYTFGIFEARFGGRQLVAVVEGSFSDAQQLLKSERTESGNTFKGFKKVRS